METIWPFMASIGTKSKQASLLWLEGFREACCLHRVFIYFRRSRELAIQTGRCFLLNGFIFLGSIFILESIITPMLQWILPDQCQLFYSQELCSESTLRFYSFLRVGLVQIFYVFWFYPMYLLSFIISNKWYSDIAKHGFVAIKKYPSSKTETSTPQNRYQERKPTDLQGIMIGVAEILYSLILLIFFCLEVYVSGFVPYIGKAMNFVLLSWMYAYYCFEYKWNLSGLSLDKRLDFFESNWPFFAGFGCPCILATFVFSPLVSYGVISILYPLFVLIATGSEADNTVTLPRREWKSAGLGRIPIFYAADYISMLFLSMCEQQLMNQREILEKQD